MSNIWFHANKLKPFVKKDFRINTNTTNVKTPLEENKNLAKYLKLKTIKLKREDLNPTGSHKDRGLAFQISAHIQEGKKEFVISSSGNSSISAINLLKNRDEKLHVFLSKKITKEKLSRIKKILPEIDQKDSTIKNFTFHFSQKPLSNAFKFAKENNYVFLRGSTDIYGYEGFKTIGYEIANEDFDSIFIPTSSGTTAKGIYESLEIKKPFHLIQTTKINTLVSSFDTDYKPSKHSIASSIVDKIGHRKDQIVKIIEKTKGTGWVITDKEIKEAQNILKRENIITSNESALTIAAIEKAKSKGWKIESPLCIFTGTK